MAELSSTQSSLDEFFKERLKSWQITSKGLITGYLDSRQAYDELIRDLKVLGCRYSVRSCYSGKTDPGSLQYKVISSDLQIPFTGSPFHVEGTTYFLCTHGIRYFKSKISSENDSGNDQKNASPKKKHRRTNESIKLGCPAKMTVKCIRVYPDYKTAADSWRRKSDVLKKLKADMKLSPPPRFEMNFWIAVSPESVHTHGRTRTQRIQPLHPELIAEIQSLVRKGVISTPVIKNQLKSFVDQMFKKSAIRPDSLNTAFYPSDKTIYNHVYDTKLSAAKEGNKTEGQEEDRLMSTVTPSTDACAPRQDHQIAEKCDSDLAAVPVLDSYASDWQDQAVLPTNFVQVLSNNGTLMLMVAQPLADQVIGRVENAVIESSTNLVNVSIEDNIYTVISDPSEPPILGLNGSSDILIPQPCSNQNSIGEVLSIQDSNETGAFHSVKNEGMNLEDVMSIESSVIMSGQSSSNILENRDVDDCSCTEDPNQYLFVEEDSQTEMLQNVKSRDKEFSVLGPLSPPQSSKEDESSLFSAALDDCNPDKNVNEACGLIEDEEILKKSKIQKKRRLSDTVAPNFESEVTNSMLVVREALRDSARDIVNMSYSVSNIALLEEMSKLFEKFRKRMRADLDFNKISEAEDVLSVDQSEKSKLKGSNKLSVFCDDARESNLSSTNVVVAHKIKRSKGMMFTASDSSMDDYDDLGINS